MIAIFPRDVAPSLSRDRDRREADLLHLWNVHPEAICDGWATANEMEEIVFARWMAAASTILLEGESVLAPQTVKPLDRTSGF